MYKLHVAFKFMQLLFFQVFLFSHAFGQTSAPTTIDLQKAQIIIDSLDKRFAQHFLNGDSVAIYTMYAKGASFDGLIGNAILLAYGKMIRNSIKNDTRIIKYTTTSLSTDAEFLVELGTFEMKDSKSNVKRKGKYLVVWKNENGDWKLYRDIGL